MKISMDERAAAPIPSYLPSLDTESSNGPGVDFAAYEKPGTVLHGLFAGKQLSAGEWRFADPYPVVGATDVSLQSFVVGATATTTPAGRQLGVACAVSESPPLPPVVTIRSPADLPPALEIAELRVSFQGVWPKHGRYSIALGSDDLAECTLLLATLGELVPDATMYRVSFALLDSMIAAGRATLQVAAGGDAGRDYVRDQATARLADILFDRVSPNLNRRKSDVVMGSYSQDASIDEQITVTRRWGLAL